MSSTSPSPTSTPNASGQASYQHNLFGVATSSTSASASASNSSSRARIATPRGAKGKSVTGRALPKFTASMQDKQARNKNPYVSDDSSSSDEEWSESHFDPYRNGSYEDVEKRRQAAIILDSPELLMMHSQARGDSIPGTRHYFMKILCGYHDKTDTYPDDGQLPDKEKEKSREKSKRFVSGQGTRK